MLYYVATDDHLYTMGAYLVDWGASLRERIALLSYTDLFDMREYPSGIYIFTDFDRLPNDRRSRASEFHDQVAALGYQTYNHPARALDRHDLLQLLHTQGINDFTAYRATAGLDHVRLPAFVRVDRTHNVLSQLVHTPSELERAIGEYEKQGLSRSDLLVLEFADGREATGLYRKFAAFLVGNRVVPRATAIDYNWNIRAPGVRTEEKIRDEYTYVTTNPHEAWIREMFTLAHIEYGRIDYGFVNGRPQVWEINTNPYFLYAREQYLTHHLPVHEAFAENMQAALIALDSPTSSVPAVT